MTITREEAEAMADAFFKRMRETPCAEDCGGPVEPINGDQYGCNCGKIAATIRSLVEEREALREALQILVDTVPHIAPKTAGSRMILRARAALKAPQP